MALSVEEQAWFRQMAEAADKGELASIGRPHKVEPGEGREVLLGAGVPAEVIDRLHVTPYEWCRQYSAGEVSRESLIYALGNLSYPPEHTKTQGLHDDLLVDEPGSTGEIMGAYLDDFGE